MSVANNFPYPATVPVAAQQALDTANSANALSIETILNNLNALIQAASQAGMYSITYTTAQLPQVVINQLVALNYLVVDNTNYYGVPLVYNYNISWVQLNYPPAGQPA